MTNLIPEESEYDEETVQFIMKELRCMKSMAIVIYQRDKEQREERINTRIIPLNGTL